MYINTVHPPVNKHYNYDNKRICIMLGSEKGVTSPSQKPTTKNGLGFLILCWLKRHCICCGLVRRWDGSPTKVGKGYP